MKRCTVFALPLPSYGSVFALYVLLSRTSVTIGHAYPASLSFMVLTSGSYGTKTVSLPLVSQYNRVLSFSSLLSSLSFFFSLDITVNVYSKQCVCIAYTWVLHFALPLSRDSLGKFFMTMESHSQYAAVHNMPECTCVESTGRRHVHGLICLAISSENTDEMMGGTISPVCRREASEVLEPRALELTALWCMLTPCENSAPFSNGGVPTLPGIDGGGCKAHYTAVFGNSWFPYWRRHVSLIHFYRRPDSQTSSFECQWLVW